MIERLYRRLMDLRNRQSEAATPAERAQIQAEIEKVQAAIDAAKG